MKNNTAKQSAKSFQREFSIYGITYPALKEAVEKQGYTVVEFNHIYNEEAVACRIDALNISDAVLRSRGFTYADCNHRVVFIHEDLSDDEKLMVLAHEEGHIYCRHMNTSPIIGHDVQDEYEANEFAHYLLNPSSSSKIKHILHRHKNQCQGVKTVCHTNGIFRTDVFGEMALEIRQFAAIEIPARLEHTVHRRKHFVVHAAVDQLKIEK